MFRGSRSPDKGLRINHRIRAREVRVIGPENEQVGILSLEEAMQRAREYELDLVEISPTAKPPVCKIIDYGKFKYLEKKRQHDARKKHAVTHLKEVKLRPRTDEHDRDYKMKHLRRFLQEGNKAKVTMSFRGREIVYADQGNAMMLEIAKQLEDVGKVEKIPMRAGRSISMVLSPLGKSSKS